MPAQTMNLQFLTNPTQRVATGKRLPTAELETLLLYGTPAARLKVLNKAAPNAHVLAANPNTYHLMEGLVRVSDPAYLAELLFAIRRHVSALAQSRHGNVVIQEVLKKVPTIVKNDLAVSLIEQAFPISCGEFGNRVIQVLLDDPTCAAKLYTALMPQFTGLVTNEFGQSVVAHALATSNDDAEKCPFWTPLINSTRSLMTSLWIENRHHVILQLIKRVSDPARCSGSGDRLWRLINKILVEELVIGQTLKGYLPKPPKKKQQQPTTSSTTTTGSKKGKSDKEKELDKLLELDEEEEEEEDNDDDKNTKMTREERDEFVADRSNIINALLTCGVAEWRDAIVSKLLEIHQFDMSSSSASPQQQKAIDVAASSASPKKDKKQQPKKNEDAAAAVVENKAEDAPLPLLLQWTQKQSLCSIIECLLRAVAGSATFKQQILSVFNNKNMNIVEMIGHRYAAIVARELVKHGDFYLGAQNVKQIAALVGQAGTLVKQPSYSSFFQALAQSSQKHADELTQILLTSDGKILKERDPASAAAAASSGESKNEGENDKKSNKKKGGNKKTTPTPPTKKKNEDEAVGNVADDDKQIEEEEEDLDAGNDSLVLAETAVDHPSASHLLQLLLGLSPSQHQISADKHAALVSLTFKRVTAHPLAFCRFATSPHGSHVVQALLRNLSDEQIKLVAALTPKARVQGKFFGVSALARNKYSCHVIIVLLQELKRRKVDLEKKLTDSSSKKEKQQDEDMMEHIRLIMNNLKPHVHFLALSAASGRKVFDTMCQVGSDKLRRMMSDVVALKCEAYLKGDPYIEGNSDHDGTKSNQNRIRAQSGSAHPFKAKHDAQRRSRSESAAPGSKKPQQKQQQQRK